MVVRLQQSLVLNPHNAVPADDGSNRNDPSKRISAHQVLRDAHTPVLGYFVVVG